MAVPPPTPSCPGSLAYAGPEGRLVLRDRRRQWRISALVAALAGVPSLGIVPLGGYGGGSLIASGDVVGGVVILLLELLPLSWIAATVFLWVKSRTDKDGAWLEGSVVTIRRRGREDRVDLATAPYVEIREMTNPYNWGQYAQLLTGDPCGPLRISLAGLYRHQLIALAVAIERGPRYDPAAAAQAARTAYWLRMTADVRRSVADPFGPS